MLLLIEIEFKIKYARLLRINNFFFVKTLKPKRQIYKKEKS